MSRIIYPHNMVIIGSSKLEEAENIIANITAINLQLCLWFLSALLYYALDVYFFHTSSSVTTFLTEETNTDDINRK